MAFPGVRGTHLLSRWMLDLVFTSGSCTTRLIRNALTSEMPQGSKVSVCTAQMHSRELIPTVGVGTSLHISQRNYASTPMAGVLVEGNALAW